VSGPTVNLTVVLSRTKYSFPSLSSPNSPSDSCQPGPGFYLPDLAPPHSLGRLPKCSVMALRAPLFSYSAPPCSDLSH